MSTSAFVSTSKARIRSSAENLRRQRLQPIALGFGGHLGIGHARRIDADDKDVARQPRELAHDEPEIVAGLDRLPGQLEGGGAVFTRDGIGNVEEQIAAAPGPGPSTTSSAVMVSPANAIT